MPRRRLIPSFVTIAAIIGLVFLGATRTGAQAPTLVAPPPNFLVAFVGDQGVGSDARSVLELIRSEGADMTLVQGDFSYQENTPQGPINWDTMISDILGPDYPLFGSQGNHDVSQWDGYRTVMQNRLDRVSGETCTGDIGRESTCRFNNITTTFTYRNANTNYIRNALTNTDSLWTICSWHHNQTAMQVGGKGNEVGWGPYETCREVGAIVATGHEHSYSRTKTLTSMQNQTIDPAWSEPQRVRVANGSTFAFVSGLGGRSIRNQDRCRPTSPPYGCNGEWASIYTSDQGARPGALFIEFNINGNPRLARGYFKNTSGQIIDEFTIVNERPGTVEGGGGGGGGSQTNTPPDIILEPNVTDFTINAGQTLRFAATAVDGDGDPLTLDIPNLAQNFPGATFTGVGGPTPTAQETPPPNPTPTGSPTFTPNPSPLTSPLPEVPSPSPSPTGGVPPPPPPPPPGNVSSPFGVYPDCIAPAVGFETHSWWHENGERNPRHVHLATCLPNARANDSGGVTVSGTLPAVFRIMAFNNPGHINWTRYAWQSNVIDVNRFSPRLQCQTRPDENKECTWYVPTNIDTSRMHGGGMDEIRLSPNVQHDDLGGTRQFATNNFQLHRGGSGNYRSSPAMIARSWYVGMDYANAQWDNYFEFFRSNSETMPTVSGTITLDVRHSKCSGSATSQGFVDPDFHAVQRGEKAAPVPFYEHSGCFSGSVQLDTRRYSNGVHGVYLQTSESNSSGTNAGAGLHFINIQN